LDWAYTVSGALQEGTEKLCLLLAVLAFTRRLRYGGMISPAEFLPGFAAMDLLLTPSAGSMGVLVFQTPTGLRWSLVVFCLSALVLGVWRRSLPGSIRAALTLVAVLSLRVAVLGAFLPVGLVIQSAYPPPWPFAGNLVLAFVFALPGIAIFAASYALALGDLAGGRIRSSWIEWGGVILTTAWLLAVQVHLLTSALLSDPVWEFVTYLVLNWSLSLGAFLITVRARKRWPVLARWKAGHEIVIGEV
jgi:hypothetical protein